jgi:hypothetical protein
MQAVRDKDREYELRWSAKGGSSSYPDRAHPDICLSHLKKIKTNIERRGLSQEDRPLLYSIFSRGDGKLTFHGMSIIFLYETMKPTAPKTGGQSADPSYSERQTRILEGIGDAIETEQLAAHWER